MQTTILNLFVEEEWSYRWKLWIFMLTILRKYTVNLYKTYILHPWIDCIKYTIDQHCERTNLRYDIRTHIKVCETFQKNKKQNLKYGILNIKEAEAIPWERLSVNILVPYHIRREGREKLIILKSLAIIHPETGWFEIVQYNDKQADTISNLVDQTWLCIYPSPMIITYERGNKFLVHSFNINIIEYIYGIKSKCATTANHQ